MAFTIPNHDVAAHPNPQSLWMEADLDCLMRALQGTNVMSGCAVTPQSPGALGVTVAAGTVQVNGTPVAVAGGNVAITTADADPRIDIVVVNSAGAVSVTKGTAAVVGSTSGPKAPSIPADRVLLAMVVVLGAATVITSSEIVDKRVIVFGVSSGALLGTIGTPSGNNRFVTGVDPRLWNARRPTPHASAHEAGGHDEIRVQGLSGQLAEPQVPIGHNVSHQKNGNDPIKLDNLATPDDNTDLNASTTAHGLMPKLINDAEKVFVTDGTQGYATTVRATTSAGRVVLPVGADKWAT